MKSNTSISEVPSSDASSPDVGQDAAAHAVIRPATPLPWNNAYILSHPEDERYAVHCVNAYARLVSALTVLCLADRSQGLTTALFASCERLLKELGE
jgi:hypothetical protein